jgi:hypothetical protein
MNVFIQILENEGEVSLPKLKHVFRAVSKRAHPDSGGGDGESFIRLRGEYEEAYRIIEEGSFAPRPRLGREEARRELLKRLYLYSIRVYAKAADALLAEMIALAGDYDEELRSLLRRYSRTMYGARKSWMRNARVYYAHNVFIIAIKQFFSYYNQGTLVAKNIFLGHRQAIEGWSGNIKPEYREILLGLYDWLRAELDKPRFEYYGI